jgi:hypothetical protein
MFPAIAKDNNVLDVVRAAVPFKLWLLYLHGDFVHRPKM